MTDFSRAVELARRRGGPAHLRILHRGRLEVDERIRVGPEASFWPFSVSKIAIATLVWALHEDGALDVDEPVAAYWPEFARAGKQGITIRDVLRHRSGLPRVGGTLAEVAAMADWGRATDRIARAAPRPGAAEAPAYEWLAWGFILGEAAQRAAGRALPGLLRERILDPIGAEGTFLGLPAEERWRAVPFIGRDPGSAAVAAVLNRRRVREAVIPAGGVSTRAGDLARLLEALRGGGAAIGLSAGSVRAMREPSNDGEFDRFAGSRVWWGNGVQLGHPGSGPLGASALGRRSSPSTFGHNGSNVSIAWTDPERELTFVYLSAIVEPFPVNRLRLMAIEDAAFEAVDGAGRGAHG
ncbi:serine hydrolase [Gulosibacter sp. 10]|uniref:serine hydrolase domain-containing protein n=1 Tax=Gulosibacter sp. 10 TaxID=1255570 RepID=UPI00097E9743|nr:serine hydrolase domain-containing protein [Gulosibacter sp. 10]SJM67359.1 putative esterase [Gulosibacter sp. 10]